jgi:hypothetical protein
MKPCLRIIIICWVAILCPAASTESSQDIRTVFSAEAARHSFLGAATDSMAASENGYQQNFENGALYYLDSVFEVHGLILGKYRQLQGPWGYLGFPLSDELTCRDGAGRYSNFQNGAVYYHPTWGTYQIVGAILSKWRAQGAETGVLGYPIADPIVRETGMSQQFQHGSLTTQCRTLDMRPHMSAVGMRVRNQSWRGTCSVFAMTCLLEYDYAQLLGGDYADLSEEYMNHVANLASGQTDDGSCFAPVAQGYQSYGVVPESWLPYDLSKAYDFAAFNLPDSTVKKGRSLLVAALKLKEIVIKPGCPSPSSMGLSSGQMDTVFTELNKWYPVAVGRGHSLVIVGYAMDSTFPGGGFFIIRNSYGPDADDHGFRYETIAHLKSTVYDTYAYEMPEGVAFGKVVRGGVADMDGAVIPGARVELSCVTPAYGTFTRYDSTALNGVYVFPRVISLASRVSVRVTGSFGTMTKQADLIADTTFVDFHLGATNAMNRQTAVAPISMHIEAAPDRNGNILVVFSGPAASNGTCRVYGLDGRLLSVEEFPRGARNILVAYAGSRNAMLFYSVAFAKPARIKNGVVRYGCSGAR